MKTKLLNTLSVSAIALAVAATGTQTIAQQTTVLEEIIVTAKQREQNLQEVPLSITVFNSEGLFDRGIQDARDLASYTPNFNVYSGSGRQDASGINIRGLAANTSDERYQPVSFFVDGIFMGGITVGLQTIDVERVEVIKGPQSATFGRATYAGAIDYVTTTPSLTDFEGELGAEVSSNNGDTTNHIFTGSISGPIIRDVLSGSLHFQSKLDEGFSQVPNSTSTGQVGREETTAFNGVLFAQLGSNTTAKLRGIFSDEDDSGSMGYTSSPVYWQQQGSNVVTTPAGALYIVGAVPDPIREGIRGDDLFDPAIASPEDGGYDRERTFLSLIVEHEFDSGMQLTYRGSYHDNSYDAVIDFRNRTASGTDPIFGDPVPPAMGDFNNAFGENAFNFAIPFPFQEEFEETSHQLILFSPGDQRLTWAAGLYHYDSTDTNFQQRTDRAAPDGNPARQTRGTEHIINTAIFGSLAYDINDQWNVSLEGRLQDEEVRFDQLLGAVGTGSIPNRDLVEEESDFEPRLTIQYQPSDDQSYYALYAKGVKSGRWNTTGDAPRDPVTNVQVAEGFIYAPPEELNNFEIGSKSILMDGRATLNGAIFYQDIKDQQLRTSVPTNNDFNNDGVPDVVNRISTAGDSEIFGFEVEGTFQATENLVLRFGLGYADHEFTTDTQPPDSADGDIFDLAGGRSLKGKTSLNSPKVTGTLGAVYSKALDSGIDWTSSIDVNYTGKRYVDLANLAYIDAFFLTNLRTTFRRDNWTLSAFVNNALDDESSLGAGLTGSFTCEFERQLDAGGNVVPTNPSQRCIFLNPQRGREVGLSVNYRF